jgi:hypothetical protein
MAGSLTIAQRFNGPPASGHGGYTCGLVAAAAGGAGGDGGDRAGGAGGDDGASGPDIAVSLRIPPPLDRALTVERQDARVAVRDGDALVALAEPAAIDIDPRPMPQPTPPAPDDPVYGELHRHPFPGCFACGPAREPGDGLRIFASRVAGEDGLVATWWTPDPSLARNGHVAPEFVWAALDCPTGHACAIERPAVLARLAVRRLAHVAAGEPHVVAAWRTGRDGRKHRAAGCLYAADGTPLAVSDALWIELRNPSSMGAAA